MRTASGTPSTTKCTRTWRSRWPTTLSILPTIPISWAISFVPSLQWRLTFAPCAMAAAVWKLIAGMALTTSPLYITVGMVSLKHTLSINASAVQTTTVTLLSIGGKRRETAAHISLWAHIKRITLQDTPLPRKSNSRKFYQSFASMPSSRYVKRVPSVSFALSLSSSICVSALCPLHQSFFLALSLAPRNLFSRSRFWLWFPFVSPSSFFIFIFFVLYAMSSLNIQLSCPSRTTAPSRSKK